MAETISTLPVRRLLKYYVGGGWGMEKTDSAHTVGAWVVRGTDMPALRVGDASRVPYRFHKASNVKSRLLEEGDIVFEVSGGSKDQPVGRALPILETTLARLPGGLICASFCKLLRPDPEMVDPRFLYYYLSSIYQSREITEFQVQSTGISNFKFEEFLDGHLVNLPSLSSQRQIADTLSAYDDLIENNTRRIAILEEMAQRLYIEWFVHFRYPGHESVPLVESELGPIPEGWDVSELSQVIAVDPATQVPKQGMKPFVPMTSLSESSMVITEIGARDGNAGSKFRNGDTLLARITPCLENGKTGYVQFLPDSDSVAFGSTEYIVLRSLKVSPEFVYLLSRSDELRGHAIKSMSGATGRQRVRADAISGYKLAIPAANHTIWQAFRSTVEPMFSLIHRLSDMLLTVGAIRNAILPRLMSPTKAPKYCIDARQVS